MDAVFIAWSRLSRRTSDLARALGVELVFIPCRPPYVKCWAKTKWILLEKRPRVLFVQLPQGPLLLRVFTLRKKLGYKILADVHTGFIVYNSLKARLLNQPFRRLLKRVDLVLSHNDMLTEYLVSQGLAPREKVLTVYDPLPLLEPLEEPGLGLAPGSYILVPASWADDEPLLELVDGFILSKSSREIALVITGNYRRKWRLAKRIEMKAARSRRKVVLTGYVPRPHYNWLLRNTRLVLASTTREYTMLSAIWEAVVAKRPFLVTETTTLKKLLGKKYPCITPLQREALATAIDNCLAVDHLLLQETIARLRQLSETSIEKLRQVLKMMEEQEETSK